MTLTPVAERLAVEEPSLSLLTTFVCGASIAFVSGITYDCCNFAEKIE